tara:strand:+ start:1133 stop:2002 length:870 start_codon:yes stop_codon:yes gene_type:complete
MTSYNKKSAIDLGWSETWFDLDEWDELKLKAKIREFQRANDLKPDGFFGPVSFEKLKHKRKPNSIMCGTKELQLQCKVVLWNDKGGLKAKDKSYRPCYTSREVKLFVNHWDVCRSSRSCIKVLNDKFLSCQFLIGAEEVDGKAIIFQTMNADHVAWHAGGRRFNDRSIGVEINNAYKLKYQDYYKKKIGKERPIMENHFVHGRPMSPHLGFYDHQLEALKELWKGICKAYNIPIQTPRRKSGAQYSRVYPPAIEGKYRGIIHHYSISRTKIDCGSLDLTILVDELNQDS